MRFRAAPPRRGRSGRRIRTGLTLPGPCYLPVSTGGGSDLSNASLRLAAIAAATLAFAVLVAACSGGSSSGGVANLGTTTSRHEAGLHYSMCMRAHGVPDFPDPSGNGEISLSDQPGSDLNPSSPAFQAAQRSCAKIPFSKFNPTPAERAQSMARLLRFARCVRAHRVPNFPDPSSLGPAEGVGFLIDRNTLDPHSPALQAALRSCQTIMPGSPGFKSYG